MECCRNAPGMPRTLRALRSVPLRQAGFPLAALLWRASDASATWSPPKL
jgi:hypothetical protein